MHYLLQYDSFINVFVRNKDQRPEVILTVPIDMLMWGREDYEGQ